MFIAKLSISNKAFVAYLPQHLVSGICSACLLLSIQAASRPLTSVPCTICDFNCSYSKRYDCASAGCNCSNFTTHFSMLVSNCWQALVSQRHWRWQVGHWFGLGQWWLDWLWVGKRTQPILPRPTAKRVGSSFTSLRFKDLLQCLLPLLARLRQFMLVAFLLPLA